jgi:hypothetical protein
MRNDFAGLVMQAPFLNKQKGATQERPSNHHFLDLAPAFTFFADFDPFFFAAIFSYIKKQMIFKFFNKFFL